MRAMLRRPVRGLSRHAAVGDNGRQQIRKPAMFELHPQLAADCHVLGSYDLSLLLMLNDAHYPWFVLVPRRPGLTELYQMSEADAARFWGESRMLSQQIMRIFQGDKLNVAALGNMVPQLHVHHIVRFATDVAWPKPVWGASPAQPLTARQLEERLTLLRAGLTGVSWQI
jgi:diadenosine tetraphosphate (Ap4A) HIT family hydrolase